MKKTATDLQNFYWDQTKASYMMTDDCDSAIRYHKKSNQVFDVLGEMVCQEDSGIQCGNEEFTFDFDCIAANSVADLIDDLVNNKEIYPYESLKKLGAFLEFEECESEERLPVKTIH